MQHENVKEVTKQKTFLLTVTARRKTAKCLQILSHCLAREKSGQNNKKKV